MPNPDAQRAPIFSPVLAALLGAIISLLIWSAPQSARAANEAPPVAVFDVVDVSASAAADVCTTALTPSRAALAYRVTVKIIAGETDSVFNVVEYRSALGDSYYEHAFNGGSALSAGNVYTFVFGATNASTFGFSFTSATRYTLLVEEIVDNHT